MTNFFQPTKIGSNTKWGLPLLALALFLVLAPTSQATLMGLTPTAPGSTVGAGLTTDPAGTLLADLLVPYSFTTTAGTTSGTIESAVYREAGGTLDFYYQVANAMASATALARETNTNFTGWTTDTGYRTDGGTLAGTHFMDGTVPPVFADSNATGSVIGFLYDLTEFTKIHPGETSTVMIIATNATNFVSGDASVIDGGTQTVAAFQPAGNVPEPGSMMLIGGGLLALAGIRRFRS